MVNSSYCVPRTAYRALFFLALCAVLCAPYPAFAQAVSSVELINNAKQYDGKVVDYQGEVIGELMRRGEYAWINVHDGSSAIGIWLHKDLTSYIVYTGSYKSKGDTLVITGIFHKNCLQHGGDLDIHAQAVRKVNSGGITSEKLNFSKRNQAIVLGGLCLLIWIFMLFGRR